MSEHTKVYANCENFCKVEVIPSKFLIGTILDYAGEIAPPGFLLCQGQAVSRAEYKDLFNVIGVRFGSGNGSTTFNVPDLREKFVYGAKGNDIGFSGGEKEATLTVEQMPNHNHTQKKHSHYAHGQALSSGAHTHDLSIVDDGTHTHTGSGVTSSDGSHHHNLVYGDNTNIDGYAMMIGWTGANTTADIMQTGYDNGAHTHTFDFETDSVWGHNHEGSKATSAGVHGHDLDITVAPIDPIIDSTGGGQPHNNMPPYVILNKIIKY